MTGAISKYIRNSDGHFVCPHCTKITEKQNTMYYHIKKTHEKDLPFVCTRCDDNPRFLQKSSYLHHLATNHADDPHPSCAGSGDDTCSAALDVKIDNPYAGVKFACPCCEHTTHTKANAQIHFARSHCKDWVPAYNKSCPCTGCGKEYASSSAYLYHAPGCFKSHASIDQLNMLSRIK